MDTKFIVSELVRVLRFHLVNIQVEAAHCSTSNSLSFCNGGALLYYVICSSFGTLVECVSSLSDIESLSLQRF